MGVVIVKFFLCIVLFVGGIFYLRCEGEKIPGIWGIIQGTLYGISFILDLISHIH